MRLGDVRPFFNFAEINLYHQIHPAKLVTDIAAAIAFLLFLWHHEVGLALTAGFIPPVIVSGAMMIRPPNLGKLKNFLMGKYIAKYMSPTIEAVRVLCLVPMAWGAWTHHVWLIVLRLAMLLLAWCNGLVCRSLLRIARF